MYGTIDNIINKASILVCQRKRERDRDKKQECLFRWVIEEFKMDWLNNGLFYKETGI